ncbi:MAG: HNH endonuclease [Candidatus Marinimicrobia bacterium]|nr:HNH endonuclease [Candidatus Neomarinimicrobiota bacterium]
MPFTEATKLKVKKKARFQCCLCHDLGVQIHHIIPQSEDGSDEEDNAAPLCPSCHDKYGANQEKRKFIHEVRDFWYKECNSRSGLDVERIAIIEKKIDELPTKSELKGIYLTYSPTILFQEEDHSCNTDLQVFPYSFIREEFVHPLIVKELIGSLADQYETIVAINLTQANNSNHFYGDFEHSFIDGRMWIKYIDPNSGFFNYSHIATTPSGINIVECYNNGGGSGIFGYIILLVFTIDKVIDNYEDEIFRERVILKTLGSCSLGDRYKGQIYYKDGLLHIGPDRGWFNRGSDSSKVIPIK